MNETDAQWSRAHKAIERHLGPLTSPGLAGETITTRYEVRDGRPRITSIEIHASEGSEVVPETLKALGSSLHVWLETFVGQLLSGPLGTPADQVAHHYKSERRRRSWSDADLREVADVFRDGGDRPREAVMAHFHVSESTAARVLRMARAKGFLEPSPKAARKDNL